MGKIARLLLVSIMALISTGARAADRVYGADMVHFEFDPKIGIKRDLVSSARVEIDFTNREARLLVEQRVFCPKGMMCAQVMQPARVFILPLVKVEKNMCGQRHFIAGKTRWIGKEKGLQMLRITDNTANTCPTFVPLEPTEVIYQTKTRSGETVNRLWGDKLIPVQ